MINVSVLYNLYSLHFLSFDFSKNRNDLTHEFLYLSFLQLLVVVQKRPWSGEISYEEELLCE